MNRGSRRRRPERTISAAVGTVSARRPGPLASLSRPAVLGLTLVVALQAVGCAGRSEQPWGAALSDWERDGIFANLPPEAKASLLPLSEIFYSRITSRRFNSRATFEDPSVRQFFPTLAAFSDYYAALVDALDRAYIRYNRPTRVELLDIGQTTEGTLLLSLRFVGRNDLPLRWWSASLSRSDEWRWQDGRWWIVPGKV